MTEIFTEPNDDVSRGTVDLPPKFGARHSIDAAVIRHFAGKPELLTIETQAMVMRKLYQELPPWDWRITVEWIVRTPFLDPLGMDRRHSRWIPGTPLPEWAGSVELRVEARPVPIEVTP